eukprot:g11476.t3
MEWVQVFHLYVAFCSFALLNVMTGVFCNSAIKAAERDHDTVVQTMLQTKKEYRHLVDQLFRQIDTRRLGHVTIHEFEEHFDDQAVRAFFDYLQIGAMDAYLYSMKLCQVKVEKQLRRIMDAQARLESHFMEDNAARFTPQLVSRLSLSPAPRPSARQWGILVLLQAAGYFGQFDRTIFGTAVPQIQSDFGLSDAEMSYAASFVGLAAVLACAVSCLSDAWMNMAEYELCEH